VGLPADHPQRYSRVIEAEFTSKVDMPSKNVSSPDVDAPDLRAACTKYERAIAEGGGVDLQILGVGREGHIAFNEPGSSLASRARLKTLTTATRRDNSRLFQRGIDDVPLHCLTQGVGTILEARHVVVLAFEQAKAKAIQQMIDGPVSSLWPCTALQLHPHVTAIVDTDAASRLQRLTYYQETYASKPSWQSV
jgi:glucosamine-6-phosphate deaminase